MRIKVEHQHNEDNISATIDGACNHAGYEIETEEFDEIKPDGSSDRSYTLTFRVCTRCKAYRRDDIEWEDWEGETDLPIPLATNTGEVFHDVQRLPF